MLSDYPKGYEQSLSLNREKPMEKERMPEAFVFAVPVKNGEGSLVRLFKSIDTLEIPPGIYRATVFVMNGSTDSSKDLIYTYLSTKGEVFSDQNGQYSIDELGNEYRLIIEEKASKSNALNLASNFATQRGIEYVVSLDADNYPSKDAVYELLTDLHASSKSLVFADITFENKNEKWKPYRFSDEVKKDKRKSTRIAGNMVAWKVKDIVNIGGWPKTISDDYSMSVVLRDKSIEYSLIESAKVWGYRAGNEHDLYKQLLRFYTGFYYTYASASENQKKIMELDHPETVGLFPHLQKTFSDKKRNKSSILTALKYFTIRERALVLGYLRSKDEKNVTTWDLVSTTV